MKINIFFFIFLLCSVSFSQKYKTRLFYIGGGGEPPGPSTIFDRETQLLFGLANNSQTLHSTIYNGGHNQSENMIQKLTGAKQLPITSENYESYLKQLEKELDQPQFSQMAVIIHTHGMANKTKTMLGEIHTVAGQNFNDALDLTLLNRLKEKAKLKGVKLAIIDFSCYSGSSLKLADQNTCVITGSNEHVGNTLFTLRFMENLKPGQSLTNVFLKAREQQESLSAPQISTQAGLKAKQISEILESQLQAHQDLIRPQVEGNLCKTKNISDQLNSLNEVLKKNNLASTMITNEEADQLKKYLQEQSKYTVEHEKTGPVENKEICINSSNGVERYCATIKSIYYMSKTQGTFGLSAQDKKLMLHEAMSNGDYSTYINSLDRLKNLDNNIDKFAPQILQLEKKLYNRVYQSQSKNLNEACSEFSF